MQAFLLPALLKVMPEKWILVSALISSMLQLVGFVLAPEFGAWAVYLSTVIGSPGSMAFPVISAVKSVYAGPEEQGTVQVRC
jgi:fucose permease